MTMRPSVTFVTPLLQQPIGQRTGDFRSLKYRDQAAHVAA